jgi:hypothetical protein
MYQPNKLPVPIRTLIYSSLFHFPLTLDELWRYSISETPISKKELLGQLGKNSAFIQKKDSYYFLSGEDEIVKIRQQEEYVKKITIAKKACNVLSFIPSILFIGVSGSLAAGSASKDADIDFFIITTLGTVWVSRLLSVILLTVVNLRRKRGVKKAPNKICLNSFVGVTMLDYFALSQELYTAHELSQLYPLLNRQKTYEQLLKKNSWYISFLPNAKPRQNDCITKSSPQVLDSILRIIDPFFAYIQMFYMKRHQTKEVVKKELILLHPYDYKHEILDRFQRKLSEYDSLTKK